LVSKLHLQNAIVENFTRSELEYLCLAIEEALDRAGINLPVSLDIVGGDDLRANAFNLIRYLDTRGDLDYLVAELRKLKPNLDLESGEENDQRGLPSSDSTSPQIEHSVPTVPRSAVGIQLLTLDELQALCNILLDIPGMSDPSMLGSQLRSQLLVGQAPGLPATLSLGFGAKQDLTNIISTLRAKGVSDPAKETPLWILLDQAIFLAGNSWSRIQDLKAVQNKVRERLGLSEDELEDVPNGTAEDVPNSTADVVRSETGWQPSGNTWLGKNWKAGAAVFAVLLLLGLGSLLVPPLRALLSGPAPTATVASILRPTATNVGLAATFTPAAEPTSTPATDIAAVTATTPAGPAPPVIKIGVDLPLNGTDAELGEPVLNGAILAVEEANAQGEIVLDGVGYKLELVTRDDAIDGKQNPLQAGRNANYFVRDPQVLAVVGPYDSSLVPEIVPKLNAAGLAQISPADTSPGSTTDQRFRPSGKVTYFRVCATDDLQARAISQYMLTALHLERIYVLDDTTPYGKGLADSVERYFNELGGTVLGHEGLPSELAQLRTYVTRIVESGAQVVVYSGTVNDNIALMTKEVSSSGVTFPPFVLVGEPGNLESRFVSFAGHRAEGTYATLIGLEANELSTATSFVNAYNERFQAAMGVYSVNGYQAIRIIIDAIKRAGRFDREAVRQAIASTQLTGEPMDQIAFDENGDIKSSWVSIYQVIELQWEFIEQVPVTRP
jgi:branched-chain amino acid transport system substrate-binding protein